MLEMSWHFFDFYALFYWICYAIGVWIMHHYSLPWSFHRKPRMNIFFHNLDVGLSLIWSFNRTSFQHFLHLNIFLSLYIVCRKMQVTEGNRPESQRTGTVFAIIGGIQLLGLFIIALLKLALYILDKRAYARYQEKMRSTHKIRVSIPTDGVTKINSYHLYKLAMYIMISNLK